MLVPLTVSVWRFNTRYIYLWLNTWLIIVIRITFQYIIFFLVFRVIVHYQFYFSLFLQWGHGICQTYFSLLRGSEIVSSISACSCNDAMAFVRSIWACSCNAIGLGLSVLFQPEIFLGADIDGPRTSLFLFLAQHFCFYRWYCSYHRNKYQCIRYLTYIEIKCKICPSDLYIYTYIHNCILIRLD